MAFRYDCFVSVACILISSVISIPQNCSIQFWWSSSAHILQGNHQPMMFGGFLAPKLGFRWPCQGYSRCCGRFPGQVWRHSPWISPGFCHDFFGGISSIMRLWWSTIMVDNGLLIIMVIITDYGTLLSIIIIINIITIIIVIIIIIRMEKLMVSMVNNGYLLVLNAGNFREWSISSLVMSSSQHPPGNHPATLRKTHQIDDVPIGSYQYLP